MTSWTDPTPLTIPHDLRAAVGGHPIIAEILMRRGITTPEAAERFLSLAAYTPASPYDLPDMAEGVRVVQQALDQQQRILIWGDFDVDGQTSTSLLVAALRARGADVTYHIPNRFSEGHGIALSTLPTWLEGIDLMITCDTGITAHESIEYARARGVKVVITDHHALPDVLPDAEAVINPMRLPEGHPMRELPGVGTAYQLIRALYDEVSTDHLLDLVAVGIVADVMVLIDDTRYWLQRGLVVLRTSPRPGLRAMMERAEILPINLTETDIAFSLGPRLNALGRLADANPAVDLLTTHDQAIIAERVNELEGYNLQRRLLTTQVYEGVQQKIADDPSLLKYAALVVSGENWHSGVVGIVASRLVDEYNCPVVILSENDGVAGGSARSVAGCNIIEAIESQSALLTRFGGHTMAAGLSLPAENVFEFRRGLSKAVREALGEAVVEHQRVIDCYLNFADITLELIDEIGRLAPFGNGNPPLTFATRNVRLKSHRTMGSRQNHLALKLEDQYSTEQRVTWWFSDLESVPEGAFDLAYTLRVNLFNGRREVMIEWVEARLTEQSWLRGEVRPLARTILDERKHPDPQARLKELSESLTDVLVWREGTKDVDGVTRAQLRKAETLVVWTIPPDPATWQAAIDLVQPSTLILFAQKPTLGDAAALIKHVGGMVKYAHQNKGGTIRLSEISGVIGHTDDVLRAAFDYFNSHTELSLTRIEDDTYRIDIDKQKSLDKDKHLFERIEILASEAAAYRQYWLTQTFDSAPK